MKIPAIDDLFQKMNNSPISAEYVQTSTVTDLCGDYMEKIKKDLIPDIPSFDNIKELSSSVLETLATSIGIDKNTFSKIMDISEKLNLSSLLDGDVNAVKTALLEQLELKNLVNEAAIISAKNNYTKIQEKYIFDAFEKSIVGLIKTN